MRANCSRVAMNSFKEALYLIAFIVATSKARTISVVSNLNPGVILHGFTSNSVDNVVEEACLLWQHNRLTVAKFTRRSLLAHLGPRANLTRMHRDAIFATPGLVFKPLSKISVFSEGALSNAP